jgi:serine/threonine-protein kinase HipA
VLLGGGRAGVVTVDGQGRLALTYDEEYRAGRNPTPLSLSLPPTQAHHGDGPVRAFLWGLLPDNEQVLERWARTYQVSAGSPFALLRHVGEDCAGAAQFVRPDRLDALAAGRAEIQWLEVEDVAERLRALRRDPTAWHLHEAGQFSLAGAQAKTALYYDEETGRWGEPHGVTPTTHILKPAVTGLDDHDLNEHLCLAAAAALGMATAYSYVGRFGPQRAIVIERYDRLRRPEGTVTRIHQEDLCQAMALPPTRKYQNESGPTPEQIITVLREHIRPASAAAESVHRFVDALAYNWIIGGTDAHAKNYSVLLSGGQVRLARLYDIASALAYDDMYLPRLRMAMKIGGEYGVEATQGRHWRRFAESTGLDPDAVVARVGDLAERAPDAFVTAAKDRAVRALRSPLPGRLVDRVAVRAAVCQRGLKR